MPLNPSSFITKAPLDSFSIRYTNDLEGYIAQKLFTPQVVRRKTDTFYQYSKDNLRIEDLTAPSGTEAPQGTYTVFQNTYTALEKAWKGLILEKDARDFDRPVADLNQEQAMQNMDKLMSELEDVAHTKATTTANYPAASVLTLAALDTWADVASDPIDDVRAQRQAIFEICGKYPNTMGMSKKGADFLRIHPGIREITKYTMKGPVPLDLVSSLMDLDVIHQSKCIKNTGLEGGADTLSSIWDDDAVLAYVDPTPRLRTLTYGKTFLVNTFYTKTIDAPQLGRGLGAHWLESGWEYALEFAARVSSADGDSSAGGLIVNIF